MFNHEPHNLDDTCEFTFTRDNNFYETTYNKLKKGDNYINQINSTDLKNITNIDEHDFCKDCLYKSFQINFNCPMCQRTL